MSDLAIIVMCGSILTLAALVILFKDKFKGLRIGVAGHNIEFSGIDTSHFCLSVLTDWIREVLKSNHLCEMDERDFEDHCKFRLLELMPQLELATTGDLMLQQEIENQLKDVLCKIRELSRYWNHRYYTRMNTIAARLCEEVTPHDVETYLEEYRKISLEVYMAQYRMVYPDLKVITAEIKRAVE